MITLDGEFLAGLGLGDLSADDQRSLLASVYEQLQMSVGLRLSERMSDAELHAFEAIMDPGDQAGALAWLQVHVPDYSRIVEEVLAEQMEELRQRRDEILDAAGVDVEG